MKNYLVGRNGGLSNGFGLFDEIFDDFMRPFTFSNSAYQMKTDIKEKENGYELSVDMPGFEKGDISVNLKNGYLTIEAKRQDAQEENKAYLRRERSFSCQRSYYVGEAVTEKDIKAKYLNGTLVLDLPKAKERQIPSGKIEIE